MQNLRMILLGFLLNMAAWSVYLLLAIILYFGWIRDWQMNWGATAAEVAQPMAGDELLVEPHLNATRAVQIQAPPERVWPWIVQMGHSRAGFYGFDKLDNGGQPSAERIIPEFQALAVGDSIALGRRGPYLWVAKLTKNESMLWIFLEGAGPWEGATWSWTLQRTEENGTRLVSRLRQRYTLDSYREVISWSVIDCCEILMMRTTLRGIKRRAEEAEP